MRTSALLFMLTLACLLALAGGATAQAAPVTLDGSVSNGTGAASASSVTFAHTTGTGTDRLLLVGVSWNCGTASRTISSVTFTPSGGAAINLTEVITQLGYNASNPRYSAIYRLVNPPIGQAGSIEVTFSGAVANGIVAGAANFAGVDQTAALGTPAAAAGTAKGTTPTVPLSGLHGDELVFDNVFAGYQSGTTLTVDPTQAQLWNLTPGTTNANVLGAASTEQASGSSVTMSWTASPSTWWAIVAVPIKPATAVVTHNLTVQAAPSGGGTVNPAAGTHTYPEGQVVNIKATASPGYVFDHWDGPVADEDAAETTVTMDGDKTVTANFTALEYTLTVNVVGHGTVTKDPNQATYHYGDSVSLAASPDEGWLFTGWSEDLSGGTSPQAVTMNDNKTVTATFAKLGVDGVASSAVGAAGVDNVTFPHATGTGSDRLLLVGVSWNCGTTDVAISSVTFTPDGETAISLDPVKTQQAGTQLRYSAIYKLLSPPKGVSGTVTVTFAGTVGSGIVAGAVNFAGVDQATPLGTPAGAGSDVNNAEPTITLPGLSGKEVVFDNVFQGGSSSSQTETVGAGQTQLWNAFSGNTRAAASTERAVGDDVTMSWTASSPSYWAIAAVPINPKPDLVDIAGATIAAIDDQTYTGSAITPDLTVELGEATLVKDTDYTVAFENNTYAGTATVTVTGMGEYSGTKQAHFNILKATPVVTAWPTASAITLHQALSASVLTGGISSPEGDFAFTAPATVPTAIGTYNADVTFTPNDAANYETAQHTVQVQVNRISIAGAVITVLGDETYTGEPLVPVMTVSLDDEPLMADADFTVSCTDNVDIGTATVTIDGIGDYTGSAHSHFQILPATPSVSAWPTATAITIGQALSASTLSGGSASVAGDFAFTSPSTVPSAVGPYSASVTFTPDSSNYNAVTHTVSVQVNAISMAQATIAAIPNQTYTGAAIEPTLTVMRGGSTLLREGTDYTVAFSNNTNVGTATVIVTGMGNYTGTRATTFTIVKATPSVNTWPTATAITIGQALSASTLSGGSASVVGDFAFTAPATVPTAIGPYDADVTFTPDNSNYNTVTHTVSVQVAAISIAGVTIEAIPDQTYTSLAIRPAVVVTVGGDTLVEDTDYTVAFSNNVNVGTATVTVTGKGSYAGEKQASFTIVKATPVINTWPSASPITAGQALSASNLSGGAASLGSIAVEGSFAFTNPATTPVVSGFQSVTFTPTDGANLETVVSATDIWVTVNAQAPVTPIDLSTATIAPIANQVYTGSAITPALVVTVGATTLAVGSDYTLAYTANVNAGKATVTVTGTGAYTGSTTASFVIVPKQSKIAKLTAGVKKFTAKWTKHSGASGYALAYSLKKASAFTTKTTTAAAKTVKHLKAGKRYYVKLRAYTTIDGTRYYGAWSTTKSVLVR